MIIPNPSFEILNIVCPTNLTYQLPQTLANLLNQNLLAIRSCPSKMVFDIKTSTRSDTLNFQKPFPPQTLFMPKSDTPQIFIFGIPIFLRKMNYDHFRIALQLFQNLFQRMNNDHLSNSTNSICVDTNLQKLAKKITFKTTSKRVKTGSNRFKTEQNEQKRRATAQTSPERKTPNLK